MNENNEAPKLMVENISCILPENNQVGGLFLGNVYGAQNPQILKQYGIRAIITASIQTKINHSLLDIPFQLKIDAHDKDDYYITEHINDCIHFIEQNRKFTNVFVHCFAGVSRSTAIVAAYLMWKYRWTLQKTISFLVFKRIAAKPNAGFYKQLKDIQAKLNIIGQDKAATMVYTSNGQSSQRQKPVIKTPAIQLSTDKVQPQKRFHSLKGNSGINLSPSKPLGLQPDQIVQQNQFFNTQTPMRQFPFDKAYLSGAQKVNNSQRPSLNQKAQIAQIFSQKQYQNHSQIPIPKVLQKRNSINQTLGNSNNNHEQERQFNNTNFNNYMSPDVSVSPHRPVRQKISLGKKSTLGLGNISKYSNTGNRQIYKDQALNIANKQLFDDKQKSKAISRCFIRPKDLPGYKNY